VANSMLSADAPSVERRKTDQKTWAQLVLQTHCPSQTVRRASRWWREICPHHPLDGAEWNAPHGCHTRLRGLSTFLTMATPAEIQAAVLAGIISDAEAEHGVQPSPRQAKPRRGRLRGRRSERGPRKPAPHLRDGVDL
jgi:hypothetical protein